MQQVFKTIETNKENLIIIKPAILPNKDILQHIETYFQSHKIVTKTILVFIEIKM